MSTKDLIKKYAREYSKLKGKNNTSQFLHNKLEEVFNAILGDKNTLEFLRKFIGNPDALLNLMIEAHGENVFNTADDDFLEYLDNLPIEGDVDYNYVKENYTDVIDEELRNMIVLKLGYNSDSWVIDNFQGNQCVKAYRKMLIDSPSDIKQYLGAGEYWSADFNGADTYHGIKGNYKILLIAYIPLDNIDWENTLRNNLDDIFGRNNEELEVNPLPNSTIYITEIELEGKEGKEKVAFKKPIKTKA